MVYQYRFYYKKGIIGVELMQPLGAAGILNGSGYMVFIYKHCTNIRHFALTS